MYWRHKFVPTTIPLSHILSGNTDPMKQTGYSMFFPRFLSIYNNTFSYLCHLSAALRQCYQIKYMREEGFVVGTNLWRQQYISILHWTLTVQSPPLPTLHLTDFSSLCPISVNILSLKKCMWRINPFAMTKLLSNAPSYTLYILLFFSSSPLFFIICRFHCSFSSYILLFFSSSSSLFFIICWF